MRFNLPFANLIAQALVINARKINGSLVPFTNARHPSRDYDGGISKPNTLSQKGRRKRAKWVNKK